jgi:hypothetical protein
MTRKLAHVKLFDRWRKYITFPLLCFFVGLGSLLIGPVNAAASSSLPAAATAAQVTIDGGKFSGIIPSTAFGANAAVWDGHLEDTAVPELLRDAGVKVMRYPGGSTSDVYHWQTNTLDNGSSAGSTTFDDFMQVAQEVGAQPIITVNYGTGTPAEAAAWVKYANITKHYHIKYWEIGNELYGNGTYGADWESDKHALGPASYAQNALQFISAMKAVDPTIKIGLVLTTPGNWPDGQTSATSPQPWNDTVLPMACSAADFVIVHWYPQGPGGESDAGLLAAPQNGESTSVSYTPGIPAMMSTLHSEINQYCGAHARDVQVMTTETNSVSYNPGKQTVSLVNALYLDEDYMTWLENGVANVDWWDIHNGIVTGQNNSSSLYGTANYGDYGMLSVGNSADGISEPPANTPIPAYYGLQMLSKLGRAGDLMVSASSNQSLVSAFAVRQLNGDIAVLLVNTDPSNSYQVSFSGITCGPVRTVYSYGENSTGITATREITAPQAPQVIPPYSLTTVVFSTR